MAGMNPAMTINLCSDWPCQADRVTEATIPLADEFRARNPRARALRGPEGRIDPATSRRNPVRGDDLVGGAAGDFGHAVESPRKAAGAGGGRTQLHDQIADLRFRHGGADAVPSRPTLAGIEAEDLAAPCRQDGVDLCG